MTLGLAAAAYAGYKQGEQNLQAQDYLQQLRANDEMKMRAQQQTYDPAAQAQVAQSNLSAGTSNAGLSLLPARTQLAQTQLGTQQIAADGAQQTQPLLNQTANNQATVQAGLTDTQVQTLPQVQGDMKLQQAVTDQQGHLTALNGLYGAMGEGADAARVYVQKVADSGQYPGLQGKQIGKVGLSADGQNFVALDPQGNVLTQLPVSAIQRAHQMSVPTEWKTAGNTLFGVQGGQVTSQTSAPEFKALAPGQTGVVTQGNKITNSTQAPVPPELANQHDSALVKNAKWIAANVTGGDNKKALALAQQANSMSKAQFISTALPNMMTMGKMTPAEAVNNLSQAYDMIRAQGAPGLSDAPASNTNYSDTINSLIGGPSTTNPASQTDNPFQ